MSVSFFGDYDTTEIVDLPFNTFTSDDPSASVTVTNLANTDVHIHKDGSATQRSSASGVTVSINFDTTTGNHVIHIDLSDNTDAGYYANGSRYIVRLGGITVDGATLNVWIGAFSIGCTLRPVTAGRTIVVDANGLADANVVKVGPTGSGTAQTANDGQADINTILARVTGNVALASVVGALNDAAAAGEVTSADTLMQYLKQLINILIGSPGIGAFPAEAAPANTVSLAEVIRAIHADVTGLNGSAMVAAAPSAAAVVNEWETQSQADPTGFHVNVKEVNGTGQTANDNSADINDIKLIADWQRCASGTVVVNNPGTDTIFDLTAVIGTLSANNESCKNMQITFFDISGNVKETRKVNAYVGASTRVTVDLALTFPVDDGVDTFILWNKYSPTAAAGGGATAQEVHEYDVSGIVTEGLAGYEIQQSGGGGSSIYT